MNVCICLHIDVAAGGGGMVGGGVMGGSAGGVDAINAAARAAMVAQSLQASMGLSSGPTGLAGQSGSGVVLGGGMDGASLLHRPYPLAV